MATTTIRWLPQGRLTCWPLARRRNLRSEGWGLSWPGEAGKRVRGTSGGSRGQSLIELALTLPLILLLFLGIMDLARAFLIYSEVSNAAREGARYGMVHPGENTAIITAARAKCVLAPAAQMTVTPSYDTQPAFGHRVVVSTEYDLTLLTPLIADYIGPLHIQMIARRTILGG